MKRLTCEMCGGTDLVKDGGVFICQTCGCKYSVEEAKKMMVEGTVDVKGTVTVDRSSEVNNILKNADTTYEDGNYKEAFDLYSQALNISPDNPHAILYRAISSAWQSSVKDCRISEINRASERAFKLQHQLYGDSKEYFDFCYDATVKIAPLINAIANMYINYYNKAMPRNYTITGAIATSGISTEVKNTMEQGTRNCCTVSSNVITYVIDGVEDLSESNEGLWTVLHNMAHNCIVYRNNARMSSNSSDSALEKKVDGMREEAKKLIEEKKKAKKEAYWIEHASEKEALENEKASLNDDIKRISSEIKAIEGESFPAQKTMRDLSDRISAKQKELDGLGMFKGKEKKALQAEIDALKKDRDAAYKEVEEGRKILKERTKPLYEEKTKLQERIREIDKEFAAER